MSIIILGKNYNINKTNVINLSDKKLINIPNEVFNLVNLKELCLENNILTNVNSKILKLVKLEELNLVANQIMIIPEEICNLINLKKLILSSNKIQRIPTTICNLTNLNVLYLNNNNIEYIPFEIYNLVNTTIILHDNKIKKLPIELLKIKENLHLDDTSYDINNLDLDCEILIFSDLNCDLINLPISLKEIYLKKEDPIEGNIQEKIKNFNLKIPFGCEIIFF